MIWENGKVDRVGISAFDLRSAKNRVRWKRIPCEKDKNEMHKMMTVVWENGKVGMVRIWAWVRNKRLPCEKNRK